MAEPCRTSKFPCALRRRPCSSSTTRFSSGSSSPSICAIAATAFSKPASRGRCGRRCSRLEAARSISCFADLELPGRIERPRARALDPQAPPGRAGDRDLRRLQLGRARRRAVRGRPADRKALRERRRRPAHPQPDRELSASAGAEACPASPCALPEPMLGHRAPFGRGPLPANCASYPRPDGFEPPPSRRCRAGPVRARETFTWLKAVRKTGTLVSGVAGRYASALFELAARAARVDAVAADLDRFDALIRESADLQRLIRSPVFTAEEQEKAVAAILDKAGDPRPRRQFHPPRRLQAPPLRAARHDPRLPRARRRRPRASCARR